jgi:hypothetical protein
MKELEIALFGLAAIGVFFAHQRNHKTDNLQKHPFRVRLSHLKGRRKFGFELSL